MQHGFAIQSYAVGLVTAPPIVYIGHLQLLGDATRVCVFMFGVWQKEALRQSLNTHALSKML